MYHGSSAILPATGMGVAIWWPLAGFALVCLGFALIRMVGTFRKEEDD